MNELDRYISEITRVQEYIYIYDEMFCSLQSRQVLQRLSPSVFVVFQKSLNSEILLSIARLFDSDGYKCGKGNIEYLSQRNLAEKYKKYIDEKAKEHREKTSSIWKELNIKNYRDIVLAHNDKASMLGDKEIPKHGVETDDIKKLLEASSNFIFEIRKSLAFENDETSLPIMPNGHRGGDGYKLIRELEKI